MINDMSWVKKIDDDIDEGHGDSSVAMMGVMIVIVGFR